MNAINFQHSKRLTFNNNKCKAMKINFKSDNIPLTVNGDEIEYVNKYKYLGDVINSKGNNDDLIASRINQATYKLISIFAISKEISLGKYEIEVLLKLYQSIFLSTILFNCQTWTNLREHSDLKNLKLLQLKFLKHIMRCPYSTPNVGIFLELGLLPIEYVIDIRQMTYLQHILSLPSDDPVNLLYNQQLLYTHEKNWANSIKSKLNKYSIVMDDNQISTFSHNKWKNIVKKHVEVYAFEQLNTLSTKMTKTKNIIFQELKTKEYITQLHPKIAREAFKIRLGMVNIRTNFKNKYKMNTLCQKCFREDETLQHIVSCNTDTVINHMDIYSDNTETIKNTTVIIAEALKARDQRLVSGRNC